MSYFWQCAKRLRSLEIPLQKDMKANAQESLRTSITHNSREMEAQDPINCPMQRSITQQNSNNTVLTHAVTCTSSNTGCYVKEANHKDYILYSCTYMKYWQMPRDTKEMKWLVTQSHKDGGKNEWQLMGMRTGRIVSWFGGTKDRLRASPLQSQHYIPGPHCWPMMILGVKNIL